MAKLPFIDEARLLAEVAKVEHTLTVRLKSASYMCSYQLLLLIKHGFSLQEEEVRRNSMMFNMLYVALSHPLSPYIMSLNDRCKLLTNEERAEIKEQLDPRARYVVR